MQETAQSFGVEITFPNPDDFLKIKETLTRIGIKAKKSNTLYQSCHILYKRGKYYIVHFKEMFALDGKQAEIDQEDYVRRNLIVSMLVRWKLCDTVESLNQQPAPDVQIDIIPYKMKSEWSLICKYNVGKKK